MDYQPTHFKRVGYPNRLKIRIRNLIISDFHFLSLFQFPNLKILNPNSQIRNPNFWHNMHSSSSTTLHFHNRYPWNPNSDKNAPLPTKLVAAASSFIALSRLAKIPVKSLLKTSKLLLVIRFWYFSSFFSQLRFN